MSTQSASQLGHHNVIVQARGDNIHVEAGLAHLSLVPVGKRIRRQLRRAIDILNPAFQAVPLAGREEDLRLLYEWLGAEAGIAITAFVGPGGSGKTRLALEILQQLPRDWQGGFLTAEEANRFLREENLSEWSWQKPTLVVVDYAALMAGTLARWFAELADHDTPEHRLRILLLERHADAKSGWYQDLAGGTWQGQAVRDLFSPMEPRRVTPLDESAQRRNVIEAGMRAAAAFVPADKKVSPVPPPGEDAWFDRRLAEKQWADPLLLLMAAVIAAPDGLNAALALSRPDLAKTLATRERDRVRKSAANPAAGEMLAHLYACVTLCGGLEREQAVEVAEGEFAAEHEVYPGGAGRAIKDLARYLGAGDWLPALAPDLLGEGLLPVTFAEKGGDVTARLSVRLGDQVAAILVRSVQDFGPAGEDWPLDWFQSLINEAKSSPVNLVGIEAAIPKDTIRLRGIAVELTKRMVDQMVHRQGPRTLIEEAYLGQLLNNLARRQSAMGQYAEALTSSTAALRIRRVLASVNSNAFLPDLAESLNTQYSTQEAMGQHENALASIGEGIKIRRNLADSKTEFDLHALAVAINNQGCLRGVLGHLNEALVSLVEAIEIHRTVAQDGLPAHLHDLAGSLNNLSLWQYRLGRYIESFESIAEAVRIRRSLAETNPDAFRAYFAESLNNLSSSQKALGKYQEALSSTREAVDIARVLVDINRVAFLPTLADVLANHGGSQHELGQHAEALASITEAIAIWRTLTESNGEAFRARLAQGLRNLVIARSAFGPWAEALTSITESVSLYRGLAENTPGAYLDELASSLNVLGSCLKSVGKLNEGRDAVAEALRVLTVPFSRHPGVFEELANATCRNYVTCSERLGVEPDAEILRPYKRLFEGGSNE